MSLLNGLQALGSSLKLFNWAQYISESRDSCLFSADPLEEHWHDCQGRHAPPKTTYAVHHVQCISDNLHTPLQEKYWLNFSCICSYAPLKQSCVGELAVCWALEATDQRLLGLSRIIAMSCAFMHKRAEYLHTCDCEQIDHNSVCISYSPKPQTILSSQELL